MIKDADKKLFIKVRGEEGLSKTIDWYTSSTSTSTLNLVTDWYLLTKETKQTI